MVSSINLLYSITVNIFLAAFYIPFIVGIFAFQRAERKAFENLEFKLEGAVNDIAIVCIPRGLNWELMCSFRLIRNHGCAGNRFECAPFKITINILNGGGYHEVSANAIRKHDVKTKFVRPSFLKT